MEEQNKKEKSILENADKWYKFYPKLPKTVFIILTVLFFIWGIVDPAVFQERVGYRKYYYGVMMLESGFVAWLLWQLIGWAYAGINYVFLKLILSPMILKIECLKEIKENTKKSNKQQEEVISKKPKITPIIPKTTIKTPEEIRNINKPTTINNNWVCKKCGATNPSTKMSCKDCGEYK